MQAKIKHVHLFYLVLCVLCALSPTLLTTDLLPASHFVAILLLIGEYHYADSNKALTSFLDLILFWDFQYDFILLKYVLFS